MTKTIILEIFHTQSIMKSAANNLSRIFGHMLRGKKIIFFADYGSPTQEKPEFTARAINDLECYGSTALSTNSVTVVSLIQEHNPKT